MKPLSFSSDINLATYIRKSPAISLQINREVVIYNYEIKMKRSTNSVREA